jgi:hypothetical protein
MAWMAVDGGKSYLTEYNRSADHSGTISILWLLHRFLSSLPFFGVSPEEQIMVIDKKFSFFRRPT